MDLMKEDGKGNGKLKAGLARKMIPFQCSLSLCIQFGICFYLIAEIYFFTFFFTLPVLPGSA